MIVLSPWVRALLVWGVHSGTDLAWQLYQHYTRVDEVTPVELRRAHLVFDWATGLAAEEDVRVTTIDFLNITDDDVDTSWIEDDYTNAEARILDFWDGIKGYYRTEFRLKEIRWYAVGPEIVHSGPPRRILPVNVSGTWSGSNQLPPQVSMTLTEKTEVPGTWGRMYLPAPGAGVMTLAGHIATAVCAAIADAAVDLYTDFGDEEIIPVVYSRAKPTRAKKDGTILPAVPARAFTVSAVQVDNIFDVQRSRRFRENIVREIRPAP